MQYIPLQLIQDVPGGEDRSQPYYGGDTGLSFVSTVDINSVYNTHIL
jgi:hypothetical protein